MIKTRRGLDEFNDDVLRMISFYPNRTASGIQSEIFRTGRILLEISKILHL